MSQYRPEEWVLLKMTSPKGEVLYKLFAAWRGGYLDGDSWKLSSNTVKITKEHVRKMSGGYDVLKMQQESGSTYTCYIYGADHKGQHYGIRGSWLRSVLDGLKESCALIGVSLEELPWDTDFEKLNLAQPRVATN